MKENEDDNDKYRKSSKDELDQTNQDKETDVNIESKLFSYLEQTSSEPEFFSYAQDNDIFKNEQNTYTYAICILLKDDSRQSSELLQYTIDGIINNFGDLATLSIHPKDLIIFVFVENINKKSDLVPMEEFSKSDNRENFMKTSKKKADDNREIRIEIINKKKYMSNIEALSCFYLCIVKNLKKENLLITSIITAGVAPAPNGLKKLIQCSFSEKNKYLISVPALPVADNGSFFNKIAQYERVHFNIYDMNFYNSTVGVPVSSLLSTMIIDDKILGDLNQFYSLIQKKFNASIDYHDYSLSIYLTQHNYEVVYFDTDKVGDINYIKLELDDYQDIWIERFSGYYANFFNFLEVFLQLSVKNKIFSIFFFIGLIVDFIYPSLSVLVIHSIFSEAYNDYHSSIFLTMLYIIAYLGSGASSMAGKKPSDSGNIFFYFFMEVYYLFILASSVVAMDNIKKKKNLTSEDENYKFNVAACVCLIVFTFLFAILPMILKIDDIIKNIVQMFMYLGLGATSTTSNLLIAKVWKAPGKSGGESYEDKIGINILIFFVFNLFFGCLSFYNYNRKKRALCVMGLAIFYLVYLFVKTMGILLSITSGIKINHVKDSDIIAKLSLESENNLNDDDRGNQENQNNEQKSNNDKSEKLDASNNDNQ